MKRFISIICTLAMACVSFLSLTVYAEIPTNGYYFTQSATSTANQYELNLYFNTNLDIYAGSVYWDISDLFIKNPNATITFNSDDKGPKIFGINYVKEQNMILANYSSATVNMNGNNYVGKWTLSNITQPFTITKKPNSTRMRSFCVLFSGSDVTSQISFDDYAFELENNSNVIEQEQEREELLCYLCKRVISDDNMFYDNSGNVICESCSEKLKKEQVDMDDDTELADDEIEFDDYETDDIDDIYEDDTMSDEVDLIVSDWAYEEVEEGYNNNLVPMEMTEESFSNAINREEFAAVAVKLYEQLSGREAKADTEISPFLDCTLSGKYYDYIMSAYDLGITNGTSAMAFSPKEKISREQMATMLYRTLVIANGDSIDLSSYETKEPQLFTDDRDISDYARHSVYFMSNNNIIRGVGDGSFAPKSNATREQAILISLRCLKQVMQ